MKTSIKYTLPFIALTGFAVTSAFAGISIIDDSFSSNTLTKDGALNQDSTGWHTNGTNSWTVGTPNGWAYNTSNEGGAVSDGAMAQIVDLSGKGLTGESQLTVAFDFVSWNGTTNDNIYVHLWGLVDNSASGTASIANMGAQNGSMWANAVDNGFSVYNLGDGSLMANTGGGGGGNAAIQLLNQAPSVSSLESDAINVSSTIDLSSYAVDTLAGYDYFVIGFARNPDVGTGNGFAIYDVAVTAVPEPSSAALLGLGGVALILRRRK